MPLRPKRLGQIHKSDVASLKQSILGRDGN